jgi:hypothetical protein
MLNTEEKALTSIRESQSKLVGELKLIRRDLAIINYTFKRIADILEKKVTDGNEEPER